MTRMPFIIAICAGAIGIVSLAQAAEQQRPSFGMLDRDGSGEITQAELAELGHARFEAGDTNGDGVLDRDELRAAAEKRAAQGVDRMLNRLDRNKDGALDQNEISQRRDAGGIFARMDLDGSGGVSEEEFAQARAKMQERRAERSRAD